MAHALLSPSSAHTWLLCTRSPRWTENIPEPPEKDYTKEGTLAHAIGEKLLKGEPLDELRSDSLYSAGMEELVHDKYVQWVRDLMDSIRLAGREPDLYVEQHVDLSRWVPECFGTSDAMVIDDSVLYVIDLKYGKGVPVSAANNPQLRLYGLGAYWAVQQYADIDEVRTVIIQPRLNSNTQDSIKVEDLLHWADDFVKPRAELAWTGGGEFNPGTDQCRFCKGRYICRHNAYYQLQTGKVLESHPDKNEMTPTEIAAILEKCDQLVRYATGLKDYALEHAVAGEQYPGYKLVSSRTTRKIDDPEVVAQLLLEKGCRATEIFDLKGITKLEETIGKKRLSELLGDHITARPGKPTLVLETDTRPAVNLKPKESDYFDD